MKPVKRPDPPLIECYITELKERFSELAPEAQRLVETRATQVVVIGIAVVLASLVYGFIPLIVRVFLFPIFIIGAWYLAGKSGPLLRWACGQSLKLLIGKLPKAPALSYLGAVLVIAFFVVGILYGAGRV